MKKIFLFIFLLTAAVGARAEMPKADDVRLSDVSILRDGSRLLLNWQYDFSQMPSSRNVETRLTPVLFNGSDSLALPSVTLAGKGRWLQAKRNHQLDLPDAPIYRAGKVTSLPYSANVAYEPWMDRARLDLVVENLGCCRSRKTLADRQLAALDMGDRAFSAPLYYETPKEERVKIRNAKGEAYIDFQVSKTNILPDYRNNPVELAKIQATIDSVKNDSDTKITSLSITGYASPEGSYAFNEKLAQGRTEALANYVRSLYAFPKSLMRTSWVAEDWAGLRRYVENSDLAAKQQILAVIDSSLSPDEKDRKLKADFPADYAYMYENWYPALRHSDYEVQYEVRSYTDPAEILRVMQTRPSKLSLREFFILGETLKPGTKEYADVFETAVRMYPDDAVANLNAANVAILQGNLGLAAERLAKAGSTPKADYARAIVAAQSGDYATAEALLAKAAKAGIDTQEAQTALARLQAPEVITY